MRPENDPPSKHLDAAVESIDDFVTMISEATAPLTGGDYFRTLVARLARSLAVEVALVTECLDYPENHVRTLALWHGSDFSEDITFDLVGTPCQDVIHGGEFCFYPEGMGRLFPDWASEEGGIESFIGIPVFAPSDGRTVGHIAVYDQRRMDSDRIVESMFRIIAARVGAEIERMQAEQALRDSEARARQHLSQLAHVSRLGALGEMASALAHEINQPLTTLTTYGQTCLHLLDQPDPDLDAVRSALEKSLEGASRAKEVVKRLRAYVTRGDIKTRLIPVQRLLDDCLVLLQTETRHHQVELKLELAGDLPPIRVDTVLIQQVLLNLVRNGVDAINHSERSERRIELWVNAEPEGQVVFEVTDSGTGIAEEILPRLFEPFASSRQNGLGIGLSLCRSILEAHDGRLWLADTSPSGARFRFSLAGDREHSSKDSGRSNVRASVLG